MARATFTDYLQGVGSNPVECLKRILKAAATLASGQNEDGTASAVLVEIAGSESGAVTSVSLGEVQSIDKGVLNADGQGINAQAGLRLVGWAATESTGSAGAKFSFRHGTSTAGERVVPIINLAMGETDISELPQSGRSCPNGVFVDIISGSIDLVLYYEVTS